jgi:hypothetical protein
MNARREYIVIALLWAVALGIAWYTTEAEAGPYIELRAQQQLQPWNFRITHESTDISDDWFGELEIGVRGHMASWAYAEAYVKHRSSLESNADNGMEWGGVGLGFEWR